MRTSEHGRTRLHAALPQFLVRDVAASAAFYERVLGMRTAFSVGTPPVFALVAFEAPGQAIQLAHAEPHHVRGNRAPDGGRFDAHVRTAAADLDRRVAELGAAGHPLVGGPVDRPWGTRGAAVEDPDGHRVLLGGQVEGGWPAGRQQISPVLVVADLGRSLAFFRDVLSFAVLDPQAARPFAATVGRDGARVHLALASGPEDVRSNGACGGWDVYFECGGIDAIEAQLRAAGARFVRPLGPTPYDMRELEIEDPDGHRLAFAEPPGGWEDHTAV